MQGEGRTNSSPDSLAEEPLNLASAELTCTAAAAAWGGGRGAGSGQRSYIRTPEPVRVDQLTISIGLRRINSGQTSKTSGSHQVQVPACFVD